MTVEDLNPYFLTPQERRQWAERLTKARNEGLFTPPAFKRDTVQLPGARGGNNWGATSADPQKGLVYLLSQDWPSITNIEGTELRQQAANSLYGKYCQTCHGSNWAGTAVLSAVEPAAWQGRLADFRQIVLAGKGEMPAFPNLSADEVNALFAGATGNRGRGFGFGGGAQGPLKDGDLGGLVVASGGAPGGLEPAP
jgi:quinoprotein glucose dehydrogenase